MGVEDKVTEVKKESQDFPDIRADYVKLHDDATRTALSQYKSPNAGEKYKPQKSF